MIPYSRHAVTEGG